MKKTNIFLLLFLALSCAISFAQPAAPTGTAKKGMVANVSDNVIPEDYVNTTWPWLDNEVSDTLTIGACSTIASCLLDGNGIYDANGSIAGNRTVTMGCSDLTFDGTTGCGKFTVDTCGRARIQSSCSAQLLSCGTATVGRLAGARIESGNTLSFSCYNNVSMDGSGNFSTCGTIQACGGDIAGEFLNGLGQYTPLACIQDGNGIYGGTGTIPDGNISATMTGSPCSSFTLQVNGNCTALNIVAGDACSSCSTLNLNSRNDINIRTTAVGCPSTIDISGAQVATITMGDTNDVVDINSSSFTIDGTSSSTINVTGVCQTLTVGANGDTTEYGASIVNCTDAFTVAYAGACN
ncbi:MAG: hypothetical protein ACXABY_22395, partial [Candidatus Thorarchaeota archaeon]